MKLFFISCVMFLLAVTVWGKPVKSTEIYLQKKGDQTTIGGDTDEEDLTVQPEIVTPVRTVSDESIQRSLIESTRNKSKPSN